MLVAFIIQYVTIVVVLMIMGSFALATFAQIAITSVVNLLLLVLNLFIFAILIRVVQTSEQAFDILGGARSDVINHMKTLA